MDIINGVFSILDDLISLYIMILAAKCIYYEKIKISRRNLIILSLVYTSIDVILLNCSLSDFSVLLLIAVFSFIVFLSRKKKRFRGLFLFIPIMGILCPITLIITVIISIPTKASIDTLWENKISSCIISIIILILIVLYEKLKKHWREKELGKSSINFEGFELRSSERNIISVNGTFLFLLLMIFLGMEDDNTLGITEYIGGIRFLIIVITILILCTLLVMVRRSISTSYYKVLSQVNEYYLEAQLRSFEVYRKSQVETKRIRHDMKNHLLCMSDLYDEKEFDKLGEYIHELNETVININKELCIGNDIADAIINEKNERAKEIGIEIQTEGNLIGITNVAPVHMCTIFANALDNAIEALKESNLTKKVINVCVRKNKNFVLISFTNPVDNSKSEFDMNNYKTSKNDSENHGFGIENIRLTSEKYNGYINCSIIDDEVLGKSFVIEVILKV